MDLRLSERMGGLSGSATREILKILEDKTIVSFAGGLPANECLPFDDIVRITNNLLTGDRRSQILQYGATDGITSARIEFAEYVKLMGVNCDYKETLIVSGGQQGIDLMCKAFLDKGDVVLVENPTYLAALQIIASYQGKAVGVDTVVDGLDLEDLETKIKKYNPKFLYVVPTFSNPTGKTYSAENRKKIAEITAKYNIMVLEDDPYSRLRFEGEAVPALKSFDNTGNVVFLTSFSKVVSPGLRVGVAVGSREVLRKLEICKQGADVHTNHLAQGIVEEYLKEGLMEKALENNLPVYKHRKEKMITELKKHMPKEFKFTNPEGGLFIWGEFPKNINTTAMFPKAIEKKVAYVQGCVFYANGSGENTLRLNFSNSSDDKIERGVKSLSEVFGTEILDKR